ncbi:ameloblastin [Erinaceus europaeus]|uniref:Ameloblastin n=1 Tax=Erinaceus europaeus TaxID=9365 RepID=A0ABM3X6J4_ERIEU|nr:ameloblastin [Erinaceus europaeus]
MTSPEMNAALNVHSCGHEIRSQTNWNSEITQALYPLFKMKDLILILYLLEMCSAVPVFPKQPGMPGMASLSLEYSRFGFGKSFNSLWMNGLLPPNPSFPWMRPREHETQQYEYSLPVHPPPLPSQPSLQSHQPGQKPFHLPTVETAIQNTIQKGGPQLPVYQGHPPLQQAEGPMIQQQVAPSDTPPKEAELPRMDFADPQDPSLPRMDFADPQDPSLPQMDFADPQITSLFPIARLIARGPIAVPQNKPSSLFPGMFYMSYGANQLNAPGRLGIMSSEEMPGGREGPTAYGAMFPGFRGMRPNFGRMHQNSPKGGDFTVEFDTPAVTKGQEKGEGGKEGEGDPHHSRLPERNRLSPENPALFQEAAALEALGGFLASPKDNIPSLAMGPAGLIREPSKITPEAADPLMTPGLADVYETYGADMTTPLNLQGESTTDSTTTMDIQETSTPGNKEEQPQVMHDAWRFQEP